MLRITIDGLEYKISFMHSKLVPNSLWPQAKAMTVCYLSIGEPTVDWISFALCSKKDNFCKETGRKVSLARALQAAGLTYGERKQIWEAYFNRPRTNGQNNKDHSAEGTLPDYDDIVRANRSSEVSEDTSGITPQG